MNKLFHVLNIVFFVVGVSLFIFGSPLVVFADEYVFDPSYRGTSDDTYVSLPDPNNLTWSLLFSGFVSSHSRVNHGYQDHFGWGDRRYTYMVNDTSYSFYYVVYTAPTPGGWYAIYLLAYSPDIVSGVNSVSGLKPIAYDVSGGSPYSPYGDNNYTDTYFSQPGFPFYSGYSGYNPTYTVGDLAFNLLVDDYMFPNVDIEDSDLDIKGLSAFILNDFQGSTDWVETSKNAWRNFLVWSMNRITGQFFDDSYVPSDLQDPLLMAGTLKNIVPGVAMSWLSPTLDDEICYNIWIDGKSDINYKTSLSPIVNFLNTQEVSTISYAKLKINETTLSQNPSVYYQYNTAQATTFLLDYIESNSSFSLPDRVDKYNYVSLETKISRVYIQASKIVDDENHVGAVSYIDIVGGVPIVHEGVTSIDDIEASDPSTGTPSIIGTTNTVSGDTIYEGDTYYDNSTTNNITTGLVVGGGDPLSALASIKKLFSAIFELVQALYLTKLLKWLFVGFTGNPLGDLML